MASACLIGHALRVQTKLHGYRVIDWLLKFELASLPLNTTSGEGTDLLSSTRSQLRIATP